MPGSALRTQTTQTSALRRASWPAASDRLDAQRVIRVAPHAPIARARHVLIIEDEILIALELEFQLGELGYASCDIADSPARALAYATARRPDLITADVQIVGGTGMDAVRQIEGRIGAVPVVYVTGNTDSLRDLADAIVVEKPISVHAFARACERACG